MSRFDLAVSRHRLVNGPRRFHSPLRLSFLFNILRTDPEKCTPQWDETQGNNRTRALSTIEHERFGCEEEEMFCRKRSCTVVFLVFRRVGEYIPLDLFYTVMCDV